MSECAGHVVLKSVHEDFFVQRFLMPPFCVGDMVTELSAVNRRLAQDLVHSLQDGGEYSPKTRPFIRPSFVLRANETHGIRVDSCKASMFFCSMRLNVR